MPKKFRDAKIKVYVLFLKTGISRFWRSITGEPDIRDSTTEFAMYSYHLTVGSTNPFATFFKKLHLVKGCGVVSKSYVIMLQFLFAFLILREVSLKRSQTFLKYAPTFALRRCFLMCFGKFIVKKLLEFYFIIVNRLNLDLLTTWTEI